MSKHDLQKENLDRIGRKLLEAARVSSDQIDEIVAAPQLFDAVKARIKAEQKISRPKKGFFFAWNLQTASSAFAVLLVLLAVAAVVQKRNISQTASNLGKNSIAPVRIQTEEPPPVPELAEKTVGRETRTTAPAAAAEKTDFRAETNFRPATNFRAEPKTSAGHAPRQNPAPRKEIQSADSKMVFYPLEVAGNWEASGEDMRVVRAELSRRELFTLGVDVPVENENTKIKTDLLIGSDGVARAIRLVE